MLVYQYPKCSTCKKALKWLDEQQISYEVKNIIEELPSAELLEKLITANNLPLTKVFNTSGKKYRELQLKDKLSHMTVKEACTDYLSQDGMLIKRPIFIIGDQAVFGFREENVCELIRNNENK